MTPAAAATAAASVMLMLAGTTSIGGCAAQRPSSEPAIPASNGRAPALDPDAVKATIGRVADWQLANPAPFDPRNWAMAPLYDGLISASEATGDPKYLAAVVRAGLRILWQPGPAMYHADDVADGQAWLRIYLMGPKNPGLLEPFKERFDQVLAKPIREPLSLAELPRMPGVEATQQSPRPTEITDGESVRTPEFRLRSKGIQRQAPSP